MKYIPREIFSQIAEHLEKPEITIIIGARQVGKTVFLEQLRRWLKEKKKVPENRIFYYNLDILRDKELFYDQTELIKFLRSRIRKKAYLFVDEAQRVENPGIFFKGIYDSKLPLKMVLTGSSSLEIRAKIHEALTGRKRIFYLYPFSFCETLLASQSDLFPLVKKKDISEFDKKSLAKAFQDYTIFGGYPRVVLAKSQKEKADILAEIYSSYIEKDIVGFLEIKKPLSFTRLVRLLAGQIGQLVNINELASSLRMDRDTAERYLKVLEETFIIKIITPFFQNPRQEVIKMPKCCFIDNGFLNYTLADFRSFQERQNAGSIFENAVFSELKLKMKRMDQLKFWRTRAKAEVDFILCQDQKIIPIEVKLSSPKRISLGLRNFIKRYQPQKAFLVSFGAEREIVYQKTKIYLLPPYKISKLLGLDP